MKLNDPFNRVARNQQRGYEAFCSQLREAGVDDLAQLQRFSANVDRMLLKTAALVILAGVVTALLLPELAGAALVFGGLVLVWLVINHLQTRAHARRYGDSLNRQVPRGGA